jgi:hypothetical protein
LPHQCFEDVTGGGNGSVCVDVEQHVVVEVLLELLLGFELDLAFKNKSRKCMNNIPMRMALSFRLISISELVRSQVFHHR